MAIVSDPSSASANAYADLDYAATYAAARLYSEAWDEATVPDQEASLIQATRLLDALVDWRGAVADEDQPLAWPRAQVQKPDRPAGTYYDAASFPTFLRNVCCEVAIDMLTDNRLQDQASGISSLGLDSLRLSFDSTDRKDIFSDHVVLLIGKHGKVRRRNSGTIPLVRR